MAKKALLPFDDFTDDFLRENTDRTIIIVGSSKIDDLLASIISKFMIPKLSNSNDQDELLEGDRPLATFSARIKVAYRLGLIDKSLYTVLEKIRKVRNIGAHQLSFNINKSPLREHVHDLEKMVIKRRSYRLTKERYFEREVLNSNNQLKCNLLTICVLLEAIDSKASKILTPKTLHKISEN